MTTTDKLECLIQSCNREQLQVMAAALWDALLYAKPTNQTAHEWYVWLTKTIGVEQ